MKNRIAADEAGDLPPLPDRLPTTVQNRVGEIELRRGLPTRTGLDRIFEVNYFQRACQLYQWAIPAIGVLAAQKANNAYGAREQTDWVLIDDWTPRAGILTPNLQIAYVVAFPNLDRTGPLVVEYSAGKIAGFVMDCWQRPLIDFGLPGPEHGATGGRILLLGPGQRAPDDVSGFHTVRSTTRLVAVIYRVLNRAEADRYTPHNRLYPHAQRMHPPAPRVFAARKQFRQSQPRGIAYWEWLHELIQDEPVQERDRLFLGMLRSLGIEKGRPFEPDQRMQQLLEDATLLGEQIVRAGLHEKRTAGLYYREGAQWQFAVPLDPQQRQDHYDEFDERTDYFYRAIGCSHPGQATTPGLGPTSLCTYRDQDGDYLDGGQAYRLRIPAGAPIRQFWALTMYDLDTRNLSAKESVNAEIFSNSSGLKTNADGSVDIHFAPYPPDGWQNNWIQTEAGRFWFLYLRLSAPTEPYYDRSWPLPDIEKVTSPLKGWWATLSKQARTLGPNARQERSPRR